MKMTRAFENQSYLSPVYRHRELPLLKTNEFDFFRCIDIGDWVYGKTISELHQGNLRKNVPENRYSKLFPKGKISYWADSKTTSLKEIQKHGASESYLSFHAYDDATSTFPTLNTDYDLIIIDGIELNFHRILDKIENDKPLDASERKLIKQIELEEPDCLAYRSVACTTESHTNFLFFESGFKKLAIKEVRNHMENRPKNDDVRIYCAVSNDYTPIIKNYGCYFDNGLNIMFNPKYIESEEYKFRSTNLKKSKSKFQK